MHFDILKSEMNSAHHDAFSGKAVFVISLKFNVWQLHTLIHIDILKSEVIYPHHDASIGKGFSIIFYKFNIWRLHKNNKLRHSEKCSEDRKSTRLNSSHRL